MAVIVPAIVQAAAGVYNIVSGEVKNAKARKMERNNKRPVYNIPQSEYDNLALSKNQASQGLSDASKQVLTQNANRGLTATLNAQLKAGDDPNAGGRNYAQFLDGISQVALADDQARVNNVNRLVAQQSRMSDFEDKAWMINKYGPFADTQQRIAQLRGQAQGQVQAGINSIGQAAGTYASSYFQNKQIEAMKAKSAEQPAEQPYLNPSTTDNPTGTPSMANNIPAGAMSSVNQDSAYINFANGGVPQNKAANVWNNGNNTSSNDNKVVLQLLNGGGFGQ